MKPLLFCTSARWMMLFLKICIREKKTPAVGCRTVGWWSWVVDISFRQLEHLALSYVRGNRSEGEREVRLHHHRGGGGWGGHVNR
jgi:hypothetical protein